MQEEIIDWLMKWGWLIMGLLIILMVIWNYAIN